MRLTFLGAAGAVTGSKYLLELGTRRVLVDCGLFQGVKRLRERNWQPLPFDPQSLDAVLLTHAHIDHSGYLPVLVRAGYRGPIYCTDATRRLLSLMLPDEDATPLYREYPDEHRLCPEDLAAMTGVAHFVTGAEESKALNQRSGPTIIIAASGMATGGRVVHHLKAFAPDARNLVLFAGYQAAGTRGAAMLAGTESIKCHGEWVPVRAGVVQLHGTSSHADYRGLVAWLAALPEAPRRVYVTHGEPAASDALRQQLRRALEVEVTVPEQGESFSSE